MSKVVNKIESPCTPHAVEYREIVRGQMFRCLSPVSDDNIYIKNGTRATLLRTGEDYSFDQKRSVVPLKPGTRVVLIAGSVESC